MIREKLLFKLPQPGAQPGPPTYSEIFGANYYEDWDFGDTAQMKLIGSNISTLDSKGVNNQTLTAVVSNPVYVSNVINGYGVGRFDGVTDAMFVNSGKGYYNFLHDGTGGAVIIIAKTRLSNPDSAYRLISSWGSTTGQGVAIRYDDRSSVSRNDQLFATATRSSAGTYSIFNQSANNAFTAGQFNSLVTVFDADNGTAADRSELIVNNGTPIKNNASTLSAASGDSTEFLNIGRTAATSSFQFDGDIARIIIVDTIPTSQQLSDLDARINYDYGI